MVVNFRAHKYASESGAQLYTDVNLDNDKALLEYSVYFPPGFDFVHGGKLPGLNGGNKKWYVWGVSSSIACSINTWVRECVGGENYPLIVCMSYPTLVRGA